jgi:DNA repair ATPase RecN
VFASVNVRGIFMQEMYSEYKRSLDLLNQRIKELQAKKKKLEIICTNRGGNIKADPLIIELNERINPLKRMKTELQEVVKEVLNYYKRAYWRNESLGMNEQKAITIYYAPIFYLDEEIIE